MSRRAEYTGNRPEMVATFECTVSAELIEAIAARVADLALADLLAGDRTKSSPYMSVDDAARYLRWPRERIYKLTAAKAIPHFKHEGRLLFAHRELDSWLEGYREGPTPKPQPARLAAER